MKKLLLLTLSLSLVQSTLAQDKKPVEIRLRTDNDFFPWYGGSDRYYTYGLFASIAYKSKKVPKWGLFEKKEVITEISYGLKGFTPSNFEENESPLTYDRPFAGWHYLGYGRRINSPNQSLFLGTTIGVLGPAAAAGRIQNWFHGLTGVDYVEGWDNQVNNQLGINLLFQYNKAIWTGRNTDFIIESHNSLGSIFTHSTSRLRVRIGKFSPINTSSIYGNKVLANGESEFFFSASAGLKAVGYNATLQGGIFNDQQLLPASDLNRGIGVFSFGLYMSRKKFSAGAEFVHTRGEVAKTFNHHYGSIRTAFIL